MNKIGKTKINMTYVVIAVIVLVVLYSMYSANVGIGETREFGEKVSDLFNKKTTSGGGGGSGGSVAGKTVNGVYNTASQLCEPNPDAKGTFFTCCYNKDKKQIDCNDGKILGDGPALNFAIYQTPGNPLGIQAYAITQGVQIVNTGNIAIEAKIVSMAVTSSPSFSSGDTVLNTAYAPIINNIKAAGISGGGSDTVFWNSNIISLQSLSNPGSPITYTVDVSAEGSDPQGNVAIATKSTQSIFTVEAEGIDFTLSMSL